MQQKNISSETRLLALFGYPSRHSLSPIIQNRFIADNGFDAVYITFEFPEDRVEGAFSGARDLGVFGLNITMPYKDYAFKFSHNKDDRAMATGSVNTIRFDDDNGSIKISGFNTDIDGIILSLKNSGYKIEDSNCLVLGAGGAARSAVLALIEKNAGRIGIYNRTRKNAEKIKDSFGSADNIWIIDSLENKKNQADFDLIINCTPLGMDTGNLKDMLPVPDNWDLKGKTVFETIYKPVETNLLNKAKADGANIVDGLDMLINQAAASFYRWFDIYPETKHIKNMIL
jgi:shikimate dehydrogenase